MSIAQPLVSLPVSSDEWLYGTPGDVQLLRRAASHALVGVADETLACVSAPVSQPAAALTLAAYGQPHTMVRLELHEQLVFAHLVSRRPDGSTIDRFLKVGSVQQFVA